MIISQLIRGYLEVSAKGCSTKKCLCGFGALSLFERLMQRFLLCMFFWFAFVVFCCASLLFCSVIYALQQVFFNVVAPQSVFYTGCISDFEIVSLPAAVFANHDKLLALQLHRVGPLSATIVLSLVHILL